MGDKTVFEGWMTAAEAADLTGYTQMHIGRLAREGEIEAEKVGRQYVINRESLLAYKERMDALGTKKHDPWRAEEKETGD